MDKPLLQREYWTNPQSSKRYNSSDEILLSLTRSCQRTLKQVNRIQIKVRVRLYKGAFQILFCGFFFVERGKVTQNPQNYFQQNMQSIWRLPGKTQNTMYYINQAKWSKCLVSRCQVSIYLCFWCQEVRFWMSEN